MFSSYRFKLTAARTFRGNWITALLVTFIASLPMTLVQVFATVKIDANAILTATTVEQLYAAANAIPQQTISILGVASLVAALISPVLAVCCNWYFLRRLHGEDIGVAGMFQKLRKFGRALWLYVLMFAKIYLWSLLLIVPGVIAAMRYAMAPYLIAEDDNLTAWQAIEKSKSLMQGKKSTLLLLLLSFVGWLFGQLVAEIALGGISPVVGTAASLFISLFASAYMNGAVAAFYQSVSDPEHPTKAQSETDQWLREHGMSADGRPGEAPKGENEPPKDENEPPKGSDDL